MEKKNSNKNIPEPANEKTVQSDMMQVDVTDDETSGDESGEYQSENEMDMVEMPNHRPITPNAYEDMSSQNHKPVEVEPVSPLKADRKRGRADTVGPQKLARPDKKEDGNALRQRLCSGLGDMISFLQQASITSPEYDFYGNLIDHIKDSMNQVENRNQPKEKEQGLATSLWGKVAAGPKGPPREPITIKGPNPKDRSPKVASPKGPGPKGGVQKSKKKIQKESKEDRQVILKIKKREEKSTTIKSHALRNDMNKTLGTMAVASVELSARGNIVVTTNNPYTAEQLLTRVSEWKDLFREYEVESTEIPTSWVKLVAHGVPVLQDVDAVSIFQQEAETFNSVKVKGSPRWLRQPTEEKRAGSVVFAVQTEEQGAYSLKNGLYIAGVRVKVVAYKAYTYKTQCYRCQGFGHNPTTCNKPMACSICSKKHLTRLHKCMSCSASQLCEHITPLCTNCKGKHMANSKECEVYKAITS